MNRRGPTDPLRVAGRRRGRTPRIGPLLGAAMAVALIAGCGGSSSGGSVARTTAAPSGGISTATTANSVTNSSTSSKGATKPSTQPSALAFAKCMRAHGVPDFPDPSSSGRIPIASSAGMTHAPSGGFTANPNSPAYETASNDCRSLAVATPVSQAQSNQMMAAQLKFSVCMRANGVPNYPDPTSTGELGDNGAISGVNPSSPAFQRAEKMCSKFLLRPPGLPGGGAPAGSAG